MKRSENSKNNISETISEENAIKEIKRDEREKSIQKQYKPRDSLLTILMSITHIKSIHRIFIAVLTVFFLNSVLIYVSETGGIFEGFHLVKTGFSKFNIVLYLWLGMLVTALLFYFTFAIIADIKKTFIQKNLSFLFNILAIFTYIVFQLTYLIAICTIVIRCELPPGSSTIITVEMIRFMMKYHAFVRTVSPQIVNENKKFPIFSSYLYFLFAPVLVFKETYPRANKINWKNVLKNFVEVLACILCFNFVYDMCISEQWKSFGKNPEIFNISAFARVFCSCSFPSILLFILCFYMLLHSWLNAWAEIMKFSDKQFYTDWWNQKGYKSYYKTWNIVVQDWLYQYVYKDIHHYTKSRVISQISVFLISGIFHEIPIAVSLGFFYPVLFTCFVIPGYLFIHVEKYMGTDIGNIFLWTTLTVGTGFVWTAYTIEFYSRLNCPPIIENFYLDLLIPRSWFCY